MNEPEPGKSLSLPRKQDDGFYVWPSSTATRVARLRLGHRFRPTIQNDWITAYSQRPQQQDSVSPQLARGRQLGAL